MELAKHSVLTSEFGMPVYFCDPQCPWQRKTNECTNSLIRQYFPQKTDLSLHSQERLSEVATQLNERPRKKLKFKTPLHMIERSVAISLELTADFFDISRSCITRFNSALSLRSSAA